MPRLAKTRQPSRRNVTEPVELCVLFAYHVPDALTRHHLALIRAHNPGVPVIPLTDDVADHLPDGVDVREFPDPFAQSNPWRRCDAMLYRWFAHRQLTAKRYLYLEYDCLCTCNLQEAYAAVWNEDVAAAVLSDPTYSSWMWFDEIPRLSSEDKPFAYGAAPLAGMFFSHRALERIVEGVSRADVFCELRLATASRKAGFAPVQLPPALRKTLRSAPYFRVPKEPGLYHPVKMMTDPVALPAAENVALHGLATQSSASPWSRDPDRSTDAQGANNGQIDGQLGFHTAEEDEPWWQVDLGEQCRLTEIRLYNRLNFADRLSRFFIHASDDGRNWTLLHHKDDDRVFGDKELTPYKVELPPDTAARFVRVTLEGFGFLHFCECEIRGARLNTSDEANKIVPHRRVLRHRRDLSALHLSRRSQSSSMRDVIAHCLLGGKRQGYFIDIGAGDGSTDSSTRLLEQEFDWRGVVCEADQHLHDSIHRLRLCAVDTRCVAGESALSVRDTRVRGPDRFRIQDDGTSHVQPGFADTPLGLTISLGDLLDEFFAPESVDYLCIGADYPAQAILEAYAPPTPRFRVISVAAGAVANLETLDQLLTQQGYQRCPEAELGDDYWYVARE